jgi:hypothetical protein
MRFRLLIAYVQSRPVSHQPHDVAGRTVGDGDCKLVATRNASEISSSEFFFGPDLPRFLIFHLKISSKCLRE